MKKLLLSLCLTIILCSCADNHEVAGPNNREVEINVGIESLDTRVVYDSDVTNGYANQHLSWETADKLGIYELGNASNRNVQLSMKANSLSDDGKSATFTGTLSNPGNSGYVAYYPYSSNVTYSEQSGTYSLGMPFPWEQTYIADSFKGLPAIATYSGELPGDFTFTNACNVIQIRVAVSEQSSATGANLQLAKIEFSFDHTATVNADGKTYFTCTDSDLSGNVSASVPANRGVITYNTGDVVLPKKASSTDQSKFISFYIALPTLGPNTEMQNGELAFYMTNGQMHRQSMKLGYIDTEAYNKIYVTPFLSINPSIAARFAGSNVIMYIENGVRKLSFAEFPEDHTNTKVVGDHSFPAIPANSQGVMFKWGSLVALSPNGAHMTAYDPNSVIFRPSEYTNAPSTWSTYTPIPYLDNQALDTSKKTNDGFVEEYGAKGFNATIGKGDICRYITAKGWVKGKWRMPKVSEFESLCYGTPFNDSESGSKGMRYGALERETVSGNTGLQYGYWRPASAWLLGTGLVASDNTNEAYLTTPGMNVVVVPISGYTIASTGSLRQPGYSVYYWSSTPNSSDNFGDSMYITQVGGVTPQNGVGRPTGGVIRCIRE